MAVGIEEQGSKFITTEAIKNQNPPVTRINLTDLIDAPVDWEKLEQGIHGEKGRAEK